MGATIALLSVRFYAFVIDSGGDGPHLASFYPLQLLIGIRFFELSIYRNVKDVSAKNLSPQTALRAQNMLWISTAYLSNYPLKDGSSTADYEGPLTSLRGLSVRICAYNGIISAVDIAFCIIFVWFAFRRLLEYQRLLLINN